MVIRILLNLRYVRLGQDDPHKPNARRLLAGKIEDFLQCAVVIG